MTSAYLIYGTAETLHASGIIATLIGSIIMGIYSKPHLSQQGLLLATFFVKGGAFSSTLKPHPTPVLHAK